MWNCRVCGLDYDASPWGPNGNQPDHSSCECCGAEFGYHDYSAEAARQFRQQWLDNGARWYYPRLRPEGWDAEAQLAQVPEEFR